MCVSTARADFAGTTVYLGKKNHPVHGFIYVLGYQNTAINLSPGPNAMLLHLPAVGMTQNNFLDTRRCHHVLKDMVRAVEGEERQTRSMSFGGITRGSIEVFEHDIYTVVLASNASLIPEALYQVPENKRIAANRPLFDFYAQCFSEYAVALCCFDNKDARQAAPLLMWYTPSNPQYLQLPALDCHTGGIPNLYSRVEVDHWIILSSDEMPRGLGLPVVYSDSVPKEITTFLPNRVIGRRFQGTMHNGDFGISHQEVCAGRTQSIQRFLPTGF
ncbi:MAG: hypothetical protein H0U76_22365 [Ktedonobacteraceae bacterium]|nr:hypothetical protein [Ktedonobacteraceae bacterium]